jgi:hypothetical protein
MGKRWGSIPQDQNYTSNELQSVNQVETDFERQRRSVREDIYRVLEQEVEKQASK